MTREGFKKGREEGQKKGREEILNGLARLLETEGEAAVIAAVRGGGAQRHRTGK